MKKIFQILVITMVIAFFSCEKTEENYVPPSVVTLQGTSLDSGGVILKGDFRNFNEDDELGFIINNNIKPILANPEEGENTFTITKGLYYNQEYSYQAYIKTETEVFYGLQESFISSGSAQIALSNISPNKGDFYDIVEIETDVALEDNDRNDVRIYFNNKIAEINDITSNKISCTVPYYEGDFISKISFEYFGKKLETSLNFELLKPLITSVSNKDVTFGDEIIINGDNFENGYDTMPKVYIDNVEANIIEKSATALKIKIPNEVKSKTPEIRVISNLQEVIANDLIILKNPIVTNYPRNVNVLDEITLIGQNFNPDSWKNTVYFENTKVEILSGDSKRLRVEVPTGIYSNWEPKIRVEINEVLKSPEYPISIIDAAIVIKSNLEIDIRSFQVINDNIYVYTIGAYTPNELEIYKYSLENNEFYDKKVVNLPYQINPLIVKTDNEFVYLYFNRDSSDFYRVNLVSGAMEKLTDFPGDKRNIYQEAYYNNNVYIGAGNTGTTYDNIIYEDFYKYSIVNNSWEQVADFVLQDYKPISYNLSGVDNSFIIKNSGEVYQFNGNNYASKNTSVNNTFESFYSSNHFLKDGKFYIFETRPSGYSKNKLRVFDVFDFSLIQIDDVLPRNYIVLGLFNYDNFVFVETIDSQYIRHLIKLDLNRI